MEMFRFGEFEVDPAARTVKRGEKPLTLNRRAFDVLIYLLRNFGKAVSKDELLRNVWPDTFVDENSVAQSISALRKALEEKPGGEVYITTLPGRGYQFTYPIRLARPLPGPTDLGLRDGSNADSSGLLYQEQTVRTTVITKEEAVAGAPAGRKRRGWQLIGGAVALSAVALGSVLLWQHSHRIPPEPIVVISDIENTTGDPGLGEAVNSAVAADLKQSPYLDFLSPVHVQDTLTQMQQKKDVPLTPALAREICLRNNAQVMLKGIVAKFGQRYLLTLFATDCLSGNSLATSKSEAPTADAIPHAIDTVATDIRRQLGESRSSIHRFETPLFAENTGSFDALRSFSNASRLARDGKYADAILMYQRAIELDPKFAMAYAELSGAFRNVGDRAQEVASLRKAFELRDSANERDRFYIVARYHQSVTGNLEEGLRNYRAWTAIYPRNAQAWGNMADIFTQLGQPEQAIDPARRSIELDPNDAVGYVIFGRALMHDGQLKSAQSVCEQAISRKLDGDDLHSLLMQVDLALNDQAGVAKQIAWGRTHASASRMRLNEALHAFSQGQIQQGQDMMGAIASSYQQQGLTRLYAVYALASSRVLAETGHPLEANRLLDAQSPPEGVMDPLVAMAETGRSSEARKRLAEELTEHPEDTLWTNFRAPQIRAALFLSERRPQDAVDALRPALPYDLRNFEVPYLRGLSYLQAKQPANAEREFRKIIDHHGVDPLSHLYALAYLGLARSLAQETKPEASQSAYDEFFVLWKAADPSEPLIKEALRESAVIRASTTKAVR